MWLTVKIEADDRPGKVFTARYEYVEDMGDRGWDQIGNSLAGCCQGFAGQGTDEPLVFDGFGAMDGLTLTLE